MIQRTLSCLAGPGAQPSYDFVLYPFRLAIVASAEPKICMMTDSAEAAEPSASKGKRQRIELDAPALAECLMPFARASGPSFLNYKDEAKNCMDAKVVHGPEGIEGSKEWMKAIQAINPSMQPPKKTTAVQALFLIREELKETPKWAKLTKKEDLRDWEETLSRRLRNPLRVVAQALSKSKPPAWVLDFVPKAAEAAEAAEDRDPLGDLPAGGSPKEELTDAVIEECLASLEPVDEDPFEYGLNEELMLPFRKRKGSDICDTGLPIVVDPEAAPEDEVVGKFIDGTEHGIGITNAEWALKWPSQQASKCLYETEHKISKHKITIKQRPDRKHILMSIYEQGKQILQVAMRDFGEAGSEKLPDDHPTVVASLEFLTPLADLYAQGGHTPASLKVERDQRLKERKTQQGGKARAEAEKTNDNDASMSSGTNGETTATNDNAKDNVDQPAAKKAKVDKRPKGTIGEEFEQAFGKELHHVKDASLINPHPITGHSLRNASANPAEAAASETPKGNAKDNVDKAAAKKTKVEKPAAKKPQPKASGSNETFDDLLDWPSMPSFDTMSLATSLFQRPT